MTAGDSRARNLEYVQYSRVEDSVTSTATAIAADNEPSTPPDAAAAATFKIFGYFLTKVMVAAILIAALGVLAGAITVALTVADRHSQTGATPRGNQSIITTASVTSSSTSSATTGMTTTSTSSSVSSTTTGMTITSTSSLLPITTSKLPTPACHSSEFACSNLACVSMELVCNGIPDCTDGSDEHISCVCTDGQFRCPNGQCVPISAVCDQHYDCLDKGDEAGCPDCAGFRCLSNDVCLWDRMHTRCDQVFDCDDYSDELNCGISPAPYNCSNGVTIHNSKVCDGLDDCGDNSDEVSCDCNKRQFACSGQRGKCIPRYWRCDGHPDCHLATDEHKCANCQEGQFQCADYSCVDSSLHCDGKVDCRLPGGDEDGCVQLTSLNELKMLLGGQMYPVCSDDWTEAHSAWVCDTLHSRSVLSTSSVHWATQFAHFAVLKEPMSAASVGHFLVSDACQSQATVHIQCHDAGCGQRKVDILESHVAGGSIAALGKWPWVVSLAYLDKPVCGGTLIAARWVLTAAHCVMFTMDFIHDYSQVPFYFTIRAGTVMISGNASSSDRHQSQAVRVSKIYFHPQRSILDNGGVDWDLALLLLEESVDMSDVVQPLCLPSHGQVFAQTSFCFLAGWGILSFRQKLRASQLRDARMQLWAEDHCRGNTVLGESAVNTNSTICAGHLFGRPASCQGDSGGPLMCLDPVSGRYTLAGLVSRGSVECGLSQPPTRSNRFARVAMAVTWIDEIMNG